MNKTAWAVLTFVLIGGITALIMVYGVAGVVLSVIGVIAFLMGLSQLYRWRSKRLLRSVSRDETILAEGLVSEETFDQSAAILVRNSANCYRLVVADKRGAVPVEAGTPSLTRQSNPYDEKCYIELQTPKGAMHFAPRKGLLIAGQDQYARQVLDTILTTLPPGARTDSVG